MLVRSVSQVISRSGLQYRPSLISQILVKKHVLETKMSLYCINMYIDQIVFHIYPCLYDVCGVFKCTCIGFQAPHHLVKMAASMAKHLTNTVAIVNSCPHRLVSVRYATGLRRSKRKGKLPEFAKSFEQKIAGRVH